MFLSTEADPVTHDTAPERPVIEEKSPPARQVSPEKQLRAALLKGRFADLIVKSQEKSFSDNKVSSQRFCPLPGDHELVFKTLFLRISTSSATELCSRTTE